jgi:hypothetical protein
MMVKLVGSIHTPGEGGTCVLNMPTGDWIQKVMILNTTKIHIDITVDNFE